MSATDGPPPLLLPRALPENTDDPLDPQYGLFHTDEWKANPVPAGPDWFTSDHRMRRDANAYTYRQIGNPSDWNRYVTLGLFTTADCTEFDDIWATLEERPLNVHQAIWYNYKYHVDHEYVSSDKLDEWAMNVSLPFLQHHNNPAFLEIDAMENERGLAQYFEDDKNPDKQNEWLPVLKKRKRPKSPPLYTSVTGFNPVENDIIRRPPSQIASLVQEKEKHINPKSNLVKLGGERSKKNRNKAAV